MTGCVGVIARAASEIDHMHFIARVSANGTGDDRHTAILRHLGVMAVFRVLRRREDQLIGGLIGAKVKGQTTGVSKHMFARFVWPGLPPLLLVAAHLLARPTEPDRCARREAQALVLANVIRAEIEREPDLAVLVAGDFNDFDDAFADADPESPNSRTLSILRAATEPPLSNVASFQSDVESRFR